MRGTKSGGDELGVGTYGCVFSPPIACANDASGVPDAKVGKVMAYLYPKKKYEPEEQPAEEELLASEKIRAADPQGEYTNVAMGRCDVEADRVREANPTRDCQKHLTEELHPQLLYRTVGTSLFNHAADMFTDPHFEGFLHLAKGIALLAKHNIAHMDIKDDNVIVDERGRLIMIDFGLSRSFDAIYDKESHYLLKSMYFLYPPEFIFYMNSHLYVKSLAATELDKFMSLVHFNCQRAHNEQYEIVKDDLKLAGNPIDTIRNHLSEFTPSVLAGDGTYESRMTRHADKIDVFGFGILLLTCMRKSAAIKHSSEFRNKCIDIVRSTTHGDPTVRWGPDQVVAALGEALALLRKEVVPLKKRALPLKKRARASR